MQIHNLKRIHKNKRDRLVGRGGKHAKTSGRGGKGQTARAGNKRRPELRDIIKKLPKNRGYQFKSFKVKAIPISLDKIAKAFPKGGAVNPETMLTARVIKKRKGWLPEVKLTGGKEAFTVKIQVSNCLVSTSAKNIIVKAGGEVALYEVNKPLVKVVVAKPVKVVKEGEVKEVKKAKKAKPVKAKAKPAAKKTK